jgi:hypothetical protein
MPESLGQEYVDSPSLRGVALKLGHSLWRGLAKVNPHERDD